jgi:NAD-dependent SIR2 family protein deacetylase
MSEIQVNPISALNQWLQEALYTTVFTGAGMSTEFGAINDISVLASGWQNRSRSVT